MLISRAVLAIGCLIAGGPLSIHHLCALGAAPCMCRRSCTRLHSRRVHCVRCQEERHYYRGQMHCGDLQRLCDLRRQNRVRKPAPLPFAPTNCCSRPHVGHRCTADPNFANGIYTAVRPLSPVAGRCASLAAGSGRCNLKPRGSHRASHTKPFRSGQLMMLQNNVCKDLTGLVPLPAVAVTSGAAEEAVEKFVACTASTARLLA